MLERYPIVPGSMTFKLACQPFWNFQMHVVLCLGAFGDILIITYITIPGVNHDFNFLR